MKENADAMEKKKFKLKMPHTFVLLFCITVVAGLLTHIIPAGTYDRITIDDRELVDPATYHAVEAAPATLFQILQAFPKGLEQAAEIVFFIFIVGGSFYVVQKSGAIDAGIAAVVRKTSKKGILLVPILSIVFAFGGGVYGMAEECLPFIPALVVLCVSLGYDSIAAAAIALVATCAGFTGAFLNPFTVGVAQGIAGLPLMSGLGYRIIVFSVMVAITITYLILYCLKIKKNPEKSLMHEIDRNRDIKMDLIKTAFTTRHKVILLVVLGTFALLVFGVLKYHWYIQEISGLFFGMAILVGILSGRGSNQLAEDFLEGCSSLTYGALVVGLARGVLVIFTDSHVIDTIIWGMANAIQELPSVITSLGIYIAQIVISFYCAFRKRHGGPDDAGALSACGYCRSNKADGGARISVRRRIHQCHHSAFRLLHGRSGPGGYSISKMDQMDYASRRHLVGGRQHFHSDCQCDPLRTVLREDKKTK